MKRRSIDTGYGFAPAIDDRMETYGQHKVLGVGFGRFAGMCKLELDDGSFGFARPEKLIEVGTDLGVPHSAGPNAQMDVKFGEGTAAGPEG